MYKFLFFRIYGQWDNSEDFLYDTSTIVQEESSSSPDKKSGLISSFKVIILFLEYKFT